MFERRKTPNLLELEIDKAIRELSNHAVGSQEYVKALECVVKLHRMKEEEKPSSVSKDTLFSIGANLVGILMVIRHEQVNVIFSRAMQMVFRIKT